MRRGGGHHLLGCNGVGGRVRRRREARMVVLELKVRACERMLPDGLMDRWIDYVIH